MKVKSAYENTNVVILDKKVELTGMNISAHASKSPKSSFDKKDNKWQACKKRETNSKTATSTKPEKHLFYCLSDPMATV